MTLLLQYTLIFAAVLMLVALGGCFSEHSGVINLGLEGIMVIGALGGALVMRYLPSGTSAFVTILLTLLGSVTLGVLFSTLLAVACINFKADQTIVGTAMNMLSVAAATVIVKALNTAVNPDDVSATIQYIEPRKAFSFQIGAFEGNWFMVIAVIALIVAYVTLYKTRFGLRLMACGEHPQAADSVGINVYKMRWAGVLISGVLGGLGGICYILAGVSEWKFESHDAICGAYYFKDKKTYADACAEYLKNCEYKEFFVSGIYNVLAAQGARIAGFACDLHLPFGTPDEYRAAEAPANKAGFDALT